MELKDMRDLGCTFFDNEKRSEAIKKCRELGHVPYEQRKSMTSTRVVCEKCGYYYEHYHGD